MTTNEKRSLAEAAITFHAMRLGLGVDAPVTQGGRYDLIFDTGAALHRVQCKWAATRRGVLVIPRVSCRRSR